MKSYTDLEQSKRLKKILPPESADMTWCFDDIKEEPFIFPYRLNIYKDSKDVPAWSLAALQDIIKINYKLEKTFLDQSDYCTYSLYDSDEPTFRTFEYDNPVDACYEMILNLHEQKLL